LKAPDSAGGFYRIEMGIAAARWRHAPYKASCVLSSVVSHDDALARTMSLQFRLNQNEADRNFFDSLPASELNWT
jgi:hypothetical protein